MHSARMMDSKSRYRWTKTLWGMEAVSESARKLERGPTEATHPSKSSFRYSSRVVFLL